MDCVYVYKKTTSKEIHYSIKSLANLPHGAVYVVGDDPGLAGTTWISENATFWSKLSSYHNQISRYLTAVSTPGVSEQIILMNDDFMIMKPAPLVNYNRGLIAEHINERSRIDQYTTTLRATADILEKRGLPTVDFELHVPFITSKSDLRQAITELMPYLTAGRQVQIRSYIGNRFAYESAFMQDVKNIEAFDDQTYLSTNDKSFMHSAIGKYIRDTV